MVKMICKGYELEVIDAAPTRVEEMARKKEILDEDDLKGLEERPPVLTIMGHVDYGKTTLLDYIRKSKVVASEAGGITQGIGAYKVLIPIDGKLQPCVFRDTPGHEISALKGENVDELMETVMLVAELQELKANPHRSAKGTVIEAGLHKSEGPLATFIVQSGTLKRGDIVVCGDAFGKVRALFDDKGNRVDQAGPSLPVELLYL